MSGRKLRKNEWWMVRSPNGHYWPATTGETRAESEAVMRTTTQVTWEDLEAAGWSVVRVQLGERP